MTIKNKKIISGAGGGSKSGGGATEAPNDLFSSQYAQIVDLICEGEIEGLVDGAQSIFIDNTPLQNPDLSYNFQDVIVDWRVGTQAQEPLIGNDSIRSETAVGVKVVQATPIIRQITDTELNSVNVTISTPRMTVQNPSTGDLSGSSVTYTIELQSNGGGYVLQDTLDITGKTITTYKRSTNVILAGDAPWDIRVTRVTADAPDSSVNNDIYFDSYTSIIDTRLNYPNSALVGIRIESKQFKSIPSRGYEVKLLKVKIPSNYDPLTRIYTGIWDGTFTVAWTDNPAWCFYDLITNDRYGLGKFIDTTLTDKWALYEIGQYCDEPVLTGFLDELQDPIYEPRFTCNLYLQKRAEAYKVIRDMASIFRAMIFWSSNGISVIQDKPEQVYSQFTNASVVDGAFNYEGSSARVRHTTALVSWNDPEDAYKQKIEYVEDVNGIAKFGINEIKTVAMGCTSRGQAHRLGKWLLFAENNETEVVSFKVGLEGSQLSPGVIIRTIDANRAGARYGGRVLGITGTVVTLDSEIVLEAAVTYTISFVLPDGTIEDKTITTAASTTDTIDIDSIFAIEPLDKSVWIVSSVNLSPEEWRVIGITEDEANIYTVSALEYNSSKYAFTEDGLALELKDSTLWDNVAVPITAMSYEESLYEIGYKTYGTKLHISWEADPSSVRFQLRWRKDSDNYNIVQCNGNDIELLNVGYGSFDFQVIAYNAIGVPSPPFDLNDQYILGITAKPANVTNFAVNIIDNSGVFTWDAVADLDIFKYEIREGTVWDTPIRVIGSTELDTYTISDMGIGTNNFMIKAIDLSGNYSDIEAVDSIDITGPVMLPITASYGIDDVIFSWESTTGTFNIASYEVREDGTDWDTAFIIANLEGNAYTEIVNWATRTLRVKAIDSNGNYSTLAVTINETIINPVLSGLASEHTSDSFVIQWEAAAGSLATVGYEVRYAGTDWNTSIHLAIVEGTAYQSLVTWDSRLFRIRAIDAFGNLSNELNVTSTITAPVAPVISHRFTADKLTLDFTSVKGTLAIKEYEIREGGADWDTANLVITTTGSTYSEAIDNTFTAKTFRIKAKDTSDKYSLETTDVISVVVPTIPIISSAYDEGTVNLTWTSTPGTFVIDHYEVRASGDTWETSSLVGLYDVSALSILVEWSTKNFFIKAVDAAGFLSPDGAKTITITNPEIASAVTQIVDNNVLLSWGVNLGTLPSDEVEISKGDVYENATVIGKKTGTFTIIFESVGGLFKYWITPIDSAGNRGAPYSITALVSQPPDYVLNVDWASDFSGDKVNAFVSSRTHLQNGFETVEYDNWIDYSGGAATITKSTDFYSGIAAGLVTYTGASEPVASGTTNSIALEIPEYIAVHRNAAQTVRITVRAKQPLSNASAQFGLCYSTNGIGESGWQYFTPTPSWQLFEFTYAVAAGTGTDYLGILGDTSLAGLGVLIDEVTISVDGTNGEFANTGSLIAPVKIDDTFAEHFTNNVWDTVDDQLAASYPYYLQPALSSASYEEIFDYGQVLLLSKVTLVIEKNVIAGNPTITPTISLSSDGIIYSDYVGYTEVIDNNFRYVKVRLDITQGDTIGLVEFVSMNIILDSKKISDSGAGSAISTDVDGTAVLFNEAFLDVESITVTPLGIVQVTPVVNFVDIQNPTEFKVLLFDSAGARYSGDFTWSARGY